MPLFSFTARMSLSGLADRGLWTNDIVKSLDNGLLDPAIETFALDYVEGLKDLMTTDVHMLDVKVKQVALNTINAPRTMSRTVFASGTGTRTPLVGVVESKTMPLDIAYEVQKNCAGDRPGRLFIRGGIGENELTISADGQYQFNNPSSFFGGTGTDATTLAKLNALVDLTDPLVIPNAKDVTLASLTTTGRTITSFTPGGVVILKRNRKRQTAEQAMIQAAQREINDAANKIKRFVRNNVNWLTVPATLAAIVALVAAPEVIVAALPAGAAASLAIPEALWETATAADTTLWWSQYGSKLL